LAIRVIAIRCFKLCIFVNHFENVF